MTLQGWLMKVAALLQCSNTCAKQLIWYIKTVQLGTRTPQSYHGNIRWIEHWITGLVNVIVNEK